MSSLPSPPSGAGRRGELFAEKGPTRTILGRVTSTRATLILVALRNGPLRFHALREHVQGITEKMVALRICRSNSSPKRSVLVLYREATPADRIFG
ncbi:winged helix-turn-helix transcriptional regulator [Nocardia paucivorans]|uniref:winged helix-turn-helix transcriptional regulator n=1 Tax=Nocardia paucivorans TaxID=114259 RepID=UPI000316BB0C|nr:winged helix-turn-helix transcriptional regulator [Nocardia paucivorans]